MPRINLLPWREELRKQRQKEFGIMAGLAVIMMAAVVALAHMQIAAMIEYQKRRNNFLEEEIVKLDKKIKEIRELEKEKEHLLARMRIVEQLQTSRPEVVHLFDELVTSLPEGVYLTSLEQRGHRINLKVFAQSNARVSSFMRKLEASPWLQNPDLKEIRARVKKNEEVASELRLSAFSLDVSQASPKTEQDGQGDGE